MYVIIIGVGRHGADLALRLSQKQHTVVVIGRDDDELAELPSEFHGRMVAGDALDRDVLHRAGIEQADGVVAATRSDALNAVLGHVARIVYNVPHVVVRNYHPRWRPVLEAFGLEPVSSTDWGVQRMEELLYHEEMHSVYCAGNGEVEIYEIVIGDAWQGRTIEELLPEGQAIAVALTRHGRATLPTADAILDKDDTLYVSTTLEGIESLRHRLASPQEE